MINLQTLSLHRLRDRSLEVERFYDKGMKIANLLHPLDVQFFNEWGLRHCHVEVGNDGIASHYQQGDNIGSMRASAYSPELATMLFNKLVPYLGTVRSTSYDGIHAPLNSEWKAVGVNPLWRWIFYPPATGQLVGHYDAPYIESDSKRTLKTLLIYLTTHSRQEGTTRFLHDAQQRIPKEQRCWDDWTRVAQPHEVEIENACVAGEALLFDHRVLHDVLPMLQSYKMVIRTDIMYERIF